jgi:hypothetical protein
MRIVCEDCRYRTQDHCEKRRIWIPLVSKDWCIYWLRAPLLRAGFYERRRIAREGVE